VQRNALIELLDSLNIEYSGGGHLTLTEAGHERLKGLPDLFWQLFLFSFSLWLRTRNLDADVYGDEGYYYYLCTHPEKYLTLHRNHPPLMYLLYSPFSYELWAARFLNAIVGATIPVLVYLWLDDSRRSIRILAGILAATSNILIRYSGVVFLDTLSSALFILGMVLYRRKRWLSAGCALGLAILAKEYALLGAVILVALSYLKYRSIKTTALLSVGLMLAMPIVSYFLFYLRGNLFFVMVAHDDPFTSVWNIFLFLSVPLALLGSRPSRGEECIIMSGYAAFIVWWRSTLDWYLVLPFSVMIMCLASSLDYLLSLAPRFTLRLFRGRLPKPEAKPILLCFLIPLIASFMFTNVLWTVEHINEQHPHELQDLTEFLSKEGYFGRQVTLVECAWPYMLYPFGELNVAYCDYPVSHYDEEISAAHIQQTKLAIIGDPPSGQREIVDTLLHRFHDAVAYSSGGYAIISLPGNGNATIPSQPLVTFAPIDENGKVVTDVRVGLKIFFAGRLMEQTTGVPLQFRPVHLYANLLGSYLTPYRGELEWNSEMTDKDGYFDTRSVDYPFKGNLAEWIEIRDDGIYFNGKSKAWSGNPQGLNLVFHADFLWSTKDGDIYGKAEEIILTPSKSEGTRVTQMEPIWKRITLMVLRTTLQYCRSQQVGRARLAEISRQKSYFDGDQSCPPGLSASLV